MSTFLFWMKATICL